MVGVNDCSILRRNRELKNAFFGSGELEEGNKLIKHKYYGEHREEGRFLMQGEIHPASTTKLLSH
jgi:hypothetical protein